jgi:hypothetical protein
VKSVLFAVSIAAALTGWQLFVPPIIGLADQGDFQKLLGPLGYAPVPKGPEHKYWFLTREFVRDPSYRQPDFEQITSEFILAAPPIALHSLLRDENRFDLTLIGLTHMLVFLLALARLLYVTRTLTAWPVIQALMLLVLTDTGYVAYWNSLYAEPASFIWFLFLLSEIIVFCTSEQVTRASVWRFSIFAVLLIAAKTQNAPLSIPLGLYLLGITMRESRRIRYASLAGAAAMLIAGVVMYRSLQPAPRVISLYDVVFYAILPDSPDPKADLAALGLSPDYVRYSGTLPWSEGTGVADGALVKALQEKVTPFSLAAFYAVRPARMLRYVEERLPAYLSLRPEFCGNYEASAGKAPGARSEAITLWSSLHERILPWAGLPIIAALPLSTVAGLVFILRNRRSQATMMRWIASGTCLAACCFLAFFVAAFGDSYDNTKHQFLFNLLLDTCFVSIAAIAATAVIRKTAPVISRPAFRQRFWQDAPGFSPRGAGRGG